MSTIMSLNCGQQLRRWNELFLCNPVIGDKQPRRNDPSNQLLQVIHNDKHNNDASRRRKKLQSLFIFTSLTLITILYILFIAISITNNSIVTASEPDLSFQSQPSLSSSPSDDDDDDDDNNNNNEEPFNDNGVEPCEVCRLLVKSFELGLERTARGKHEGGDTSWEEKNLKSYADSEVRLVEIQERICEDVKSRGKAQCLFLAEETETDIEDWWFKQRNKNVRLHDYLCISKLKRCCPVGKFGPTCQACPIASCNKHGTCNGDGTRLGTGKCDCETGYEGEQCADCSGDYYRVATGDDFACRICDSSCRGCFGPGQNNCTECRQGYYKHELNGCIDVNECEVGLNIDGNSNKICRGNTYCINTDGSYKCANCHSSCQGCVGYGPNMCIKCAFGYEHDDEYFCRNIDSDEEDTSEDLFRTRKRGIESRLIQSKVSRRATLILYVGFLMIVLAVFGLRRNLYATYIFLIGFIIFLLLDEFNLLDEYQDDIKMSSD